MINQQVEQKYIRVRDAMRITGLSENTITRAIHDEQFVTFKVRRTRLIDHESFMAWISGKPWTPATGHNPNYNHR